MEELTPEQEVQRAHDIKVAEAVATRAEEAACRLMAEMIDAECENAKQSVMATALVTAAMIVKFGEAKLAVPDGLWGETVDKLVEQMRPIMKEVALDVRFRNQP